MIPSLTLRNSERKFEEISKSNITWNSPLDYRHEVMNNDKYKELKEKKKM